MRALMEAVFDNRHVIPQPLQHAIDELVSATKSLRLQLEQVATTVGNSQSQPSSCRTHAEEESAAVARGTPLRAFDHGGNGQLVCDRLTGSELHSLTVLAGEPADRECDTAKRRYSYDCQQMVYPWLEEDGSEAISPGVLVRCHDISGHGIPFFGPIRRRFSG
jgi:hypothetical protein